MKLTAQLPLEDGSNTVAIAARDQFDLTGRSVFVIQRTEDSN